MSKNKSCNNVLSTKKSNKSLIVALLSGLVTLNSSAYAQNVSVPNISEKPINTPTLDYLYPQTKSPISSGYKLTHLQMAAGGPIPKGVIAQYVTTDTVRYYNSETGDVVDVAALENGVDYKRFDIPQYTKRYYDVGLKNTVYGQENGATSTNYYNWDYVGGGYPELKEAAVINSPDSITHHVNTTPVAGQLPLNVLSNSTLINNQNNFIEKIESAYIGVRTDSGSVIQNTTTQNNIGTISQINGHFIANYATSSQSTISGGAISNIGVGSKISNINADFIGNYLYSDKQATIGGAIYNADGKIGNIVGDFIGNAAFSGEEKSCGGAIYNTGTIDNIVGTFYNNFVNKRIDDNGGAIYNSGIVSSITGEFVGNTGYFGGAVFNSGTLTTLKADFMGNDSFYGAVGNTGSIDLIEGNFFDNKGYYSTSIHNEDGGEIKLIKGNFVGNSTQHSSMGSVIENEKDSQIGTIDALFAENVVDYAIENQGGVIDSIISDFVSNARGGINNYGSIVSIESLFIDNGSTVVYNKKSGVIDSLKSDFIGNNGISIYNEYGIVESIIGDFVSNKGKAIANTYGHITLIDGLFKNNVINFSNKSPMFGSGAAIHNHEGFIDLIMGEFISNSTNGVNNYGALGGAIYNTAAPTSSKGIIKEIRADFIGNVADAKDSDVLAKDALGGAIYNEGIIEAIVNSNFFDNYAKSNYGLAQGGAIFSKRDLNIIADNGVSEFTGNYVDIGGQKDYQAIFMSHNPHQKDEKTYDVPATLNLIAKNNGTLLINDKISGHSNVITNAYRTEFDNQTKTYTKIYTDENRQDLPDNSTYTYDNYKINFDGDASGKVVINNNIEAVSASELADKPVVDMNLYAVTLKLANRDNVLDGNNLSMHSGTLDMINGQIGVASLNKLSILGETSLNVDVDLVGKTMDTIKADSYVHTSGAAINVAGMNLINDAPQGQDVTEIYFADSVLKDYVSDATGGNLPHSQHQILTPIYKYNVAYDNRADSGWFIFARGDKVITPSPDGGTGGSGGNGGIIITPVNPSEAFNPAVLASPVASQVGAMATIGQTFNYAFQNSDNFMATPYAKRYASRNANRYALTDSGVYSPLYTKQDSGSVWVKPYSTFESVSLDNGPKVSNVAYGTLIGADSEVEHLKRGWDRVWTGYIGYNGSNQSFSGVDTTQSGGLLGGTVTMYKGNFFNATTLTTGASVGFTTNMYGNEHFSMLMAGIGNKSGYNYEFKDGKVIIQPNMLLNYAFVNTFDYRNAAGVKIDSEPLHAIQLVPGIKVIGNLKNSWQPYASVNMIWNLMGKTDVTANGVKLPEMSVKPYVQYGVGVQKSIKDRSMAFAQVMLRNGGRTGVALSFGFRWALGKEGKSVEKVSNPQDVAYTLHSDGRKVLKQMNSTKKL
ncbi:MAG: hypothetical protein E7Z87_04740 [Cyanobacteria bacterium SIG26]|nr:hypothetical protein [Cyanobacteria bacterium SIG26]